MKIDDYIKASIANPNETKKLVRRISNIPPTTTEYSISEMIKLKSIFWHMPVAKNGIKMRCIIANFNSEDYDKALKTKWKFENRILALTDLDTKCCFICGSKFHMANECQQNVSIQ